MINWNELHSTDQLSQIRQLSFERPQVIFKHSTRCSISHMAKARLERANSPEGIDFYYLDLLAHRDISNRVAEDFSVYHESPQVLVIRGGDCVYDESHNGISMDELIEQVSMTSK